MLLGQLLGKEKEKKKTPNKEENAPRRVAAGSSVARVSKATARPRCQSGQSCLWVDFVCFLEHNTLSAWLQMLDQELLNE